MTTLTFDIYIRATPEQVWEALMDPAMVPRFRFGLTFDTDWKAGSPLTTRGPEGKGTVQAVEPGRRLAYDWIQTDDPAANAGKYSTVAFDLMPMGESTRVTLTHSDLDPDAPFLKIVEPGWPMILSSLKSLLETGEALNFRPSA